MATHVKRTAAPKASSNVIEGTVYILPDNIDTDQILTAEYMKINPADRDGYEELGSLAMCGLPETFPPFVNKETGKAIHTIIIAGENFGCGSSREHAPVALGSSGVVAIVAQSFARIFFRNCISTGEVLPVQVRKRLCDSVRTGDAVRISVDKRLVRILKTGEEFPIEPIGELVDIISAGGIFPYARKIGKI